MTSAGSRAAALTLALLVSLLGGCGLPSDGPQARGHRSPPEASREPSAAPHAVLADPPVEPRSLRGTESWRLTRPALDEEIEGYAQLHHSASGDRLRLMVSTTARRFRAQVYRIGGYRGGSGRLVWSSSPVRGRVQKDPSLIPETRTVVAGWAPSVSTSTATWPAGFYIVKLVASSGYEALVPVTLPSSTAVGRVVLSAPTMTWQAYNRWGGYSLYDGPPGGYRSWAVSFDRPFEGNGAGRFLYDVLGTAVLAERLGVPLAYTTDVDVSTRPGFLDGAVGYVVLGHAEYWTVPERRAVTRARDHGTNLAFLSANTMYWRVRLEASDASSQPLVVGYRGASGSDPYLLSDPARATARWRDPPSPDPENSLTGTLYECYPVDEPYRVVSPRWWGFRGTRVAYGTEFAHLVAYEADRVYPVPGTPRPLRVLSHVDYYCDGAPTSAQSTYYTTPSGAGVISFGTQRWSCAVRRRCAPLEPTVNAFVRRVMTNVLRAFSRGPVGLRHPARDNIEDFDLPEYNAVPAS